MKLKSIKLHPFAGIRDKEFQFENGLNVLLGPNEAGKSTVFHAILNGLLTTTSLTAKQVDDTMGLFFPVSGGDTIRVTLVLEDEQKSEVRIAKTWKKGTRNGSASLHLPDGTEITDEEEIQKQIEELLPVSPATMKTILLADQSGLHHTIREMEKEDKVRKELGDLLRQNLMETGGVSVDRFRELLDTRYDEYFKRWDRDQDYPENNRGINNPYKVGTGKILDAYYQKEQLRLDLEEAKRFENELDQLNEQLSELVNRQKEKKEEFEKLEPLKKGISQRKDKEQRLENAELKKKSLLEISQKWPVLEDRIKNLEPKKKEQQDKIEKLQIEQKKAQNKQRAEQLKAKIKKLEELSVKVGDAKKEVEEAKKVEQSDVQELRKLKNEISNLKNRIEGARLTLRIEAESEQNFGFTEAGNPEEKIEARQGKTIEKKASGGFTLSMDGVKIDVFSGEGDLEEVVKTVSGKEQELKNQLEKLNVDSLQSAESVAELYRQNQQELSKVESLYQSELGDDDIEKLKTELEELGDLDQVRSVSEISDDLVDARTAFEGLKKDAEAAQDQIAEWQKEYDSVEDVIMELAETSKFMKDLKAEIEELPELPSGFESADEFIEKVESLDREIRDVEQKISEKKIEKANLEKDAPDTSSEELEKMKEEAESEFERIHKEGETLARVRERTQNLLESMDANTYSGLEKSFLNWLQKMVKGRFEEIQMNGDLPSTFTTDDCRPLTYSLLSHGTKDTVALAWRFALTEHFLQDQSGFIILDDPMVDMDPDRRELASNAIEEFSKEQQVLVMTCHPEHGELLKHQTHVEIQS
ncbi:hypothetical protein DYD21_08970 [Rhodohalobacter sp. SW132]|uniref:AAA family ATPase n=1 Tax=Rhodohalobacter sp. SW132 TaxID=2293433 RepID=UPI000E24B85D|nr:AAA family ATPase [Rhodohalobacter sp. SW132]REL37901.1 hypothetical protein DYD21_08970 [Rhodohalobacter sp. SW132]